MNPAHYRIHFPARRQEFKLKIKQWSLYSKDNKWPSLRLSCYLWFWSSTGLTVETICAGSQYDQKQDWNKIRRKKAHFQEVCGHNENKQVRLFPITHLWELQPNNKNTQALKSAPNVPAPKSKSGLKNMTSVCGTLLDTGEVRVKLRNLTSLLLHSKKRTIPFQAEKTAQTAQRGEHGCGGEPQSDLLQWTTN